MCDSQELLHLQHLLYSVTHVLHSMASDGCGYKTGLGVIQYIALVCRQYRVLEGKAPCNPAPCSASPVAVATGMTWQQRRNGGWQGSSSRDWRQPNKGKGKGWNFAYGSGNSFPQQYQRPQRLSTPANRMQRLNDVTDFAFCCGDMDDLACPL